jgi:hypothetical protein
VSLRDHLGRNASLITVGLLLAGSAPVIVSSVAAATPGQAVLLIEGTNTFARNQSISSTYRFAKQPLHVRQGQGVLIRNETDDGHTITLVSARDLPGNFHQMNNCAVCNDVNNMYFPPGSQSPAGVQIDNGHLTDDDSGAADADTPDPAVPLNAPFTALVEDFDTASHSNPGGAPSTIGDSTLIGPKGSSQGPDRRNIVITAAPGTYHFFCTFHAWMQGTIIVS